MNLTVYVSILPYMSISKITVAALLFALSFPVVALAQSDSQNASAIESAALASLPKTDRAQVQNILGLLSTGQIEASTAVIQIDAVLSDDDVKAVLAEAKKANRDADDAGQFLVDLAQPMTK